MFWGFSNVCLSPVVNALTDFAVFWLSQLVWHQIFWRTLRWEYGSLTLFHLTLFRGFAVVFPLLLRVLVQTSAALENPSSQPRVMLGRAQIRPRVNGTSAMWPLCSPALPSIPPFAPGFICKPIWSLPPHGVAWVPTGLGSQTPPTSDGLLASEPDMPPGLIPFLHRFCFRSTESFIFYSSIDKYLKHILN